MAIPQVIRINPLDLQKNISIGISLPFGVYGTEQLFNKTYSTKDQIKSNLINLLLTNKGERIMNPLFGCDLKKNLFENITTTLSENIKDTIISATDMFMPEITIYDVIVNTEPDENMIDITLNYVINLSGTSDQITIQFQ
jgi:phage baseplate assembly protein W